MASTPRLKGAPTKLYAKTEGTFGTAPSGDWVQLPFFSLDLASSAELQEDPALSSTAEITRDSTGLYLGRQTTAGQAIVPVDLENFGVWLRLLLGAPSSTGSSDYTHTWVSGTTTALPSASMEKVFSQITQYGVLTGVKANTMSFAAGTEQRPRATFGLIAQDETYSGTSSAGTPTFAGSTSFHQRQYSVTDDGSALGNCMEFTLNYSNGLEAYYDLNSNGQPVSIEEGQASCSGTFRTRVSPDTIDLLADAVAGTSHALVLKCQISSTKLIQFTIHEALLSQPGIGIPGPGGIDVTFSFRGQYNTSGGEMMEAILKNQIASYA